MGKNSGIMLLGLGALALWLFSRKRVNGEEDDPFPYTPPEYYEERQEYYETTLPAMFEGLIGSITAFTEGYQIPTTVIYENGKPEEPREEGILRVNEDLQDPLKQIAAMRKTATELQTKLQRARQRTRALPRLDPVTGLLVAP